MTILSKLDVMESLAASICLSSLPTYDENTVTILVGRLNSIHSNFTCLLNLISTASKKVVTDTDIEPVEN